MFEFLLSLFANTHVLNVILVNMLQYCYKPEKKIQKEYKKNTKLIGNYARTKQKSMCFWSILTLNILATKKFVHVPY